jgi:hypothetical protein
MEHIVKARVRVKKAKSRSNSHRDIFAVMHADLIRMAESFEAACLNFRTACSNRLRHQPIDLFIIRKSVYEWDGLSQGWKVTDY